MIVSAAVKIHINKSDKDFVLPCHRHWNIPFILHEIGLQKDADYQIIEEGFLDEEDNFFNRSESANLAFKNRQIKEEISSLFSEDLW